MEANENISYYIDYIEPDPETLERIPRYDELGQAALLKSDCRVRLIDGDELECEPLQIRVIRYPAVYVTAKPVSPENNRFAQ